MDIIGLIHSAGHKHRAQRQKGDDSDNSDNDPDLVIGAGHILIDRENTHYRGKDCQNAVKRTHL